MGLGGLGNGELWIAVAVRLNSFVSLEDDFRRDLERRTVCQSGFDGRSPSKPVPAIVGC